MGSFLFLAICVLIVGGNCVMFHLSPNTQKCLQEDMQANQLVMGEYEVSDVPGQVMDYIVSSIDNDLKTLYLFLLYFRLGIQKDIFYRRRNT